MTSLSPGAALAWKIAAFEAVHLNAAYLEKEHLFIGLLSLDKVVAGGTEQAAGESMEQVTREWAALSSLLEITGHDPVVLRRLMRSALRKGTEVREGAVVHRSPACREIFRRAAQSAGEKPAGVPDLFSAIMEQPGEVIAGVLAESRRCKAAERQTDILLPPGGRMTDSTRTSAMGFDLKESLRNDIRRYEGSLSAWPEQSREYALTTRAICRNAAGLAHLCLDSSDRDRLREALESLAKHSCSSREEATEALSGLDAAGPGDIIPEIVRDRIRILIRKTGEEQRDEPGA